MNGLARILRALGYNVSGSDMQQSDTVEHLRAEGIPVSIGHRAENLVGQKLLIYTAAIHEDNPERVAARQNSIPEMERSVLLGQLSEEYRFPIGVSGTNGKTTTTSMLASIFIHAGADPTVHIGGELGLIGGSVAMGRGPHFITEACEYVDSFLELKTVSEIVLNIEEDHLDYFKDIEDIYKSFLQFTSTIADDGILIYNGDDLMCRRLAAECGKHSESFGLSGGCDWHPADVTYEDGYPSFMIMHGDECAAEVRLSVPGEFNVSNALAAVAMAAFYGISPEISAEALQSFVNSKRRFEFSGKTAGGADIYNDYAHHPDAIEKLIGTARAVCRGEIYAVFQPHTYTRTYRLFDGFTKAFAGADHLVITPIYAAREKDEGIVSSKGLAEAITEPADTVYADSIEAAARMVSEKAKAGDMVLVIGAGTIIKLVDMIKA